MSEAVLVAIITGGLTLIGTVFTVFATSSKTNAQLRINQAVTDTKIDTLTKEVKDHNEFAKKMPVIEEQIKTINHRLDDLERSNQ